MKILITGFAGFVGRHFVRTLATSENHLTLVDDLSTGLPMDRWAFPPAFTKNLRVEFTDLRNWLPAHNPAAYDLVIHCAAVVGGRLKIEGDPLAVATNLSLDAELFNWIVRGACLPHLIYFSSSAVYPTILQTERCHCALGEGLVDLTSQRIGMPDGTYGYAKLTGEYLASVARAKYGLPVSIYRPFSGYGEDQDTSYPFPTLVRRVIAGENPVTVWGSGNQARDWIHIFDIVSGVLQTYKEQKTLNLGSGRATTFPFLVRKIAAAAGRQVRVRADASKPEGVFHRVADTYEMEPLFVPLIGLEDGIGRVVRHLTRAPAGVV